MLKISICSLLVIAVIFNVIPHRTSATPLIRRLRSPDTTPESHISNFLHQHRSDSRADKAEDTSTAKNVSDPVHTSTHRPHMTTTEPPVSQTELLVNLIHNTIQTFRDQFPLLLSLISSPRDPPSTTMHPKKEHHAATHGHSKQVRSTNVTSSEDVGDVGGDESGERSEENNEIDGNGEDEVGEEGEEEEPGDDEFGDLPDSNNNAALLPPALLKTIVEASAGSAGRGSAGATAGLLASTSAGSSTGSSSSSGRATRQIEEHGDQEPTGSGEFLVGILRTKARALTTLFFAPFLSASSFVQRSIGYASGTSSGLIPEDDRPTQDVRHTADHSHHHSDNHHHNEGHVRDQHDHGGHHAESHGHGHQSNDHGHHSSDHGHHSNDHGHHAMNNHGHNSSEHAHHTTESHHETGNNYSTTSNEIQSANLIFNGYEDNKPNHQVYFRAASNDPNNMISTDDLLSPEESPRVPDGPVRIVLVNGNFDDQPEPVQNGAQRNTLD